MSSAGRNVVRHRLFIKPTFINFSRLSSSGFNPRAKVPSSKLEANKHSDKAILGIWAGFLRSTRKFVRNRGVSQTRTPAARIASPAAQRTNGRIFKKDKVQTTRAGSSKPNPLASRNP